MSPANMFANFAVAAGAFLGLAALISLIWQTRLSRILGLVSLVCILVSVLIYWVEKQRLPPLQGRLILGSLMIPGVVAMIFQRTPRIPHGHCKTCGYNLRGNVSGKCSECGAPVPAP